MAVVEVEVELLTGRTHQIRGQLSSLGFPLCGDVMYGGSLISPASECFIDRQGYDDGYRNSEYLSLQCCELTFSDPSQPSQLNKFRIEKAWWSCWIDEYEESAGSHSDSIAQNAMSYIQLSPGTHKYVLVKASKPDGKDPEWYVRSSSPAECGGLYHSDVAKSLVEHLKGMNYNAAVVGGGRIEFREKDSHAHIYGFSYAFGKGDHEFVSLLIEKYSNVTCSFDNSDLLY